MKKVFFAIVAVSLFAFTACNNKPAEGETATTDTAAVVAPVEETAPVAVDSAAAPADSTAAPAAK